MNETKEDIELLTETINFATIAHAGQERKYTRQPYIEHPLAVMNAVKKTPSCTLPMLQAAVLHDTVEDTQVTLTEIVVRFGVEVADMVEMLTDISKPSDGNRSVRMFINRGHTAKASPQAKTIKLADIIDNVGSIAKHDPDFAKIYFTEKALSLNILREGDPGLWNIAKEILWPSGKILLTGAVIRMCDCGTKSWPVKPCLNIYQTEQGGQRLATCSECNRTWDTGTLKEIKI